MKTLSGAFTRPFCIFFVVNLLAVTASSSAYQKPGAPIAVHEVSENKLVMGHKHDVQLTFAATQSSWLDDAMMSATVLPNPSLGVFEPIEQVFSSEALALETWYLPVSLVPQAAGMHYLTVEVAMNITGIQQIRTSEVKFQVFASVIEKADAVRAEAADALVHQKTASNLPAVIYEKPLAEDFFSPSINISPAEEVQK